ncbi:MAG TPA: helix-turn-helix domain-containing protein [Acidimicrobiales bacterium]|jgi:AcrR family transcriptional regulator
MTLEPLTAERRRQQTRDYLLQAAAQVFAERGFHGASLDEVAAAAGYTKGAVYSNFKNKEDLFLALLEAGYSRERVALRETLEASEIPPEARLGDFAALIRSELDQAPDNWGSLYLEFSLYAMRNPAVRERLNELEAEDIRGVADIIESGQNRLGAESGEEGEGEPGEQEEPTEEAMTQARLVTALFRGISLMRSLDPDAVGPELLEDAIAFATRGLGVATPE